MKSTFFTVLFLPDLGWNHAIFRRVASPELKCKPTEARGLGAALGPQWVQGRALVGGSGGQTPPTENDFSKSEPNKTHRKCPFFEKNWIIYCNFRVLKMNKNKLLMKKYLCNCSESDIL